MLKAARVVAGNLSALRGLLLGQIVQTILTGSPILFLYLAVMELQRPEPRTGALAAIFAGLWVLTLLNLKVSIRVHVRTYTEAYETSTDARLRLADHLRRLSLGFFRRRDPGEISAVMLQDMAKVEMLFSHLLNEAAAMLTLTVLMALGLLTQNLRITALMLASVAVAAPALAAAQRVVDLLGSRQMASRNRAASRILEYLAGMNTLKAFNLTGRGFKRLDEALLRLKKDSVWLEAASGAPVMLFALILELGLAAMLVYATSLLSADLVPAAVFVMFVVLGTKFFEPLLAFGLFFTEVRYMSLAAGRIATVLEEKPLPALAPTRIPERRDVEFRGVTFAYDRGGRPVINDLSLAIPERSLTALVGPSGSGKTTLAGLMARFWDVDSGAVLIGGVDVRSVPPDELNALFAFVFQEVHLFGDSVLENIRAGDRSASPEAVRRAAEAARCLDFIERLPERWDTRVGEGGAALSGGERQRISIARAILKNAPIVVLDEATASLDPENELSIQRAVSELIREKTVVVIAHRLRTVVAADQLAVIDDGRVAELGDHESLLARGGLYAALYEEQTKTGGWRLPKRAAVR